MSDTKKLTESRIISIWERHNGHNRCPPYWFVYAARSVEEAVADKFADAIAQLTRERDAAVADLAVQRMKNAFALRLLECDEEFIELNTRSFSAPNDGRTE